MFRKIHSNRDPNVTLFSEIRKEFEVYFEKANSTLSKLFFRFPWQVFTVMILTLAISLVVSFLPFKKPLPDSVKESKDRKPVQHSISPVSGGLNGLIETASTLRQTLILRREVEALLQKKQLTPADSAALKVALQRLGKLNSHLIK